MTIKIMRLWIDNIGVNVFVFHVTIPVMIPALNMVPLNIARSFLSTESARGPIIAS